MANHANAFGNPVVIIGFVSYAALIVMLFMVTCEIGRFIIELFIFALLLFYLVEFRSQSKFNL